MAVRDRCGAAGKECVGFWPLVEEQVDVSQILDLSVAMASELHSCGEKGRCDVCSYIGHIIKITARYAKSCYICKNQSCELSFADNPVRKKPNMSSLSSLKDPSCAAETMEIFAHAVFSVFVLVLTASVFDE